MKNAWGNVSPEVGETWRVHCKNVSNHKIWSGWQCNFQLPYGIFLAVGEWGSTFLTEWQFHDSQSCNHKDAVTRSPFKLIVFSLSSLTELVFSVCKRYFAQRSCRWGNGSELQFFLHACILSLSLSFVIALFFGSEPCYGWNCNGSKPF